jgi:hypothetical protein
MSTTVTESTFDRLARLRSELAQTEADLVEATARRDASECVRLSNHARVLKDFIAEDAAQATVESEQLNREEAIRLVAELSESYRDSIGLLDAASEDVRGIVKEAAQAISAVSETFNRIQWVFRAIELLRLRYPGLGGATVAPPPAPPNLAVALFATEGKAVENVPRPVIVKTASYTREQIEQAGFDALEDFVGQHAGQLPAQVREFFAHAGARPRG